MATFAAAARMITLAISLLAIAGIVYFWGQSVTAKLDAFGPGCAAEFSC